MRRPLVVLALLSITACRQLEQEPAPRIEGQVEPDIFDVLRAGNSKAAVAALRDRYQQEVQHARLLEARIGELIAAEEGLAIEHHERLQALQAIKDQVRKLADEQAALMQAIDEASRTQSDASERLTGLQQENAALEQAIQAELARRDELRKSLDVAEDERRKAE